MSSTAQPDQSDDLLSLDRQVCFALVVASRAVLSIYRPLLDPLGLTHPQYLVMLALWERAPRSVKELSQVLDLDPGTLSPLLKRLEAAGLVVRERDRSDERLLAVQLTDRGRALRKEAESIPLSVVEHLGLGLDELENLRDGLHRLIAAARPA